MNNTLIFILVSSERSPPPPFESHLEAALPLLIT